MPPPATAETTGGYRCTTGGYRATGGDAPAVLRAPVVGAWTGVGIGSRGHMARSEIRMVWRWDYSGYSLVCGGGVWCVHILHTCVWVCGWGVGMAVMCWGRWDDRVVWLEVGGVVLLVVRTKCCR